jgi:uncharacterized protein YndB with AHSA1/START domain
MTTTEHSVLHSTFVIERTYPASPRRVFNAFADPAIKSHWFGSDDFPSSHYALDFRVGGREINRGGPPDGPVYTFEARYADIVPNERIVTTYDMYMGEQRISVSVATVELVPDGSGSRMVYTDQGAYFDGLDTPEQREHGTNELFNALGAELERSNA